MEQEVTFVLKGTKPLIMHNSRLANPLDPYARELSKLTSKKKKTPEDYSKIAYLEARGSMYETEDGIIGLPAGSVFKSLSEAAKAFNLGEAMKRSFSFVDDTVPMLIEGKEEECETYLDKYPHNLDFQLIRLQNRRTMRGRTRIPKDWSAKIRFVIATEELDLENLEPIMKRAGRFQGLCDWRPRFGQYTIEIESVKLLEEV